MGDVISSVSALTGLNDTAFTDSGFKLLKNRMKSEFDSGPHMSRMTSQPQGKMGGAWCPKSNASFESLDVDLQTDRTVRFITTKGCDGREWFVRSYRLKYATQDDVTGDVINFRDVTDEQDCPKVFEGNTDNTGRVQHSLGKLKARYVKIIPMEFEERRALRWELYAECRQAKSSIV